MRVKRFLLASWRQAKMLLLFLMTLPLVSAKDFDLFDLFDLPSIIIEEFIEGNLRLPELDINRHILYKYGFFGDE